MNEELTRLRTQHRAVQAQLQQLAPLTTALEASRARQRDLAALQREVSTVLQERAVVDDLAVRVKDVDVADDRQSLLVRLLVDHPVTGALAVRLRLWQGGGELLDVRGNRAAAARAERCLERAAALKLDVTTLDQLPQAIATALQTEGERQAELSTAAGRREGLQGQLALLERNGKERKHELEQCSLSLERDSDATLAAQRAEVERRAAEAGSEAVRLLSELEETLGDAALDDPREAAQRRVDVLSAEVAVLERQLADADALRERAAALGQALDEAAALLAEGEQAVGGTAREAAVRSASLAQRLELLGEPALRAREQELQRAAGAVEARLHRSDEDLRALTAAGARLTNELGLPIQPERLAEAAPDAFPELLGALASRAEIETHLSALAAERGAAERGAADARATLGKEDPQPLADAEGTLRALEEQHAARRRGQEIVSLTRQRMINKVLPDTINNMCVLLPQLTADRYRYAELTPEYKLQVWDERAKAYVEKSLFSGGTQDQFSLALRLGFALAALPRELGTSPGFLFLDEPLSSFDRDRSEALVALLTRGQVSTFFRQVLLISHSQAFDPTLFNHHVLMEHGRVAQSTLPSS